MSQESGTSSTSSNLETQLADAMMVIQTLMANVGNLIQQVIHMTQNMAYMQAAQNVSQPSPQPSPHHFPLSPSPQQPLSHLSLFALAQDHAAPMPSSSRVKEPKIANPLPFSGKRDDIESFIIGCCLYINGRKSEFPMEDAKIYWILLYMQTGSAKTWRNYVVTLMFKGQQSFTTSDELLREIDQKFGDTDKRTTQSLKIRTLQQGDKLVDEHVQDFEKAALKARYEEYPLVVEFKRSLNAGLQRRLTELRPMPVTIEQWYDKAITMDCQWKIAKTKEAFYGKVNGAVRKPPQYGQQGQGNGQGQASSLQQGYQQQFFRNQVPPQYGQCQNTGQLQRDPNAMDIDRNQARRPPLRCFKCNGLGHMERDCQRQLDVRGMTYDQMAEYFKEMKAAAKDREELMKKKDFLNAAQ